MPKFLRYTIIVLVACLLFLPFLGQVHLFDWDEINFAECAREMIVSKDYLRPQIDFMPFWEKPPLFIWMQVLSMKLFGVGAYAARFPNAFMGIITLVTIYHIGKRVVSEKLATWWVVLYMATWLPHFYFKTGIIDPTFNFFIFLSFFQLHLVVCTQKKLMHSILAGVFLGLAVLTKGPVAILIAVIALAIYLIRKRGAAVLQVRHLFTIAFFALLPMLLWLVTTVATYGVNYGKWFISEFISYQVRLFSTEDADHGGPFLYHFIVLLIGCFPASVFFLQYRKKRSDPFSPPADFARWMSLLFWVVLILFSIVKTKIVHYSSLCYFPLTYLAALQIIRISEEGETLKRWIKTVMISIGSVLALLITALPVVGINKTKLIPYIDDPFAVANLSANVSWSYAECLWGLLYITGIVVAAKLMDRNFKKGLITLCAVQVVMIQVTILHFTPKIEAYTQRSAIDFYKSFAGKDVYIQPVGFKSYANLFYAEKISATNPNYRSIRMDKNGKRLQPEANETWLMTGNVDKPTYFICKVQDTGRFSLAPQIVPVGGANGFAFFKRK